MRAGKGAHVQGDEDNIDVDLFLSGDRLDVIIVFGVVCV